MRRQPKTSTRRRQPVRTFSAVCPLCGERRSVTAFPQLATGDRVVSLGCIPCRRLATEVVAAAELATAHPGTADDAEPDGPTWAAKATEPGTCARCRRPFRKGALVVTDGAAFTAHALFCPTKGVRRVG